MFLVREDLYEEFQTLSNMTRYAQTRTSAW